MEGASRITARRIGPLTDRDLVVAFKGGDARAYASIYREYRPLAESVCLRILGNREDAQEAAQETMLRVFQGLPRFNGRYLLRAWVARIATNVCLDALRRRERRPGEVETPDAEELENLESVAFRAHSEDPSELVERHEETLRVRAVLDELPQHHRDALLMREFDGMSHEQIAEKLGMTAPQVKALLHRAKKGLKRAWDVDSGRASAWIWPVLLAPFKWIRRATSPARNVAMNEVTPVIHLSSQPFVMQASTALTDKFTAAAGAILVAGTLGLGAAAIPHHASAPIADQDRPSLVVDVMPATHVVKHHAKHRLRAHRARVVKHRTMSSSTSTQTPRAFEQQPRPSQIRSTASPAPTTDPSSSASSSPSPTPEPVEPRYAMNFTMDQPTNYRCSCDPTAYTGSNAITVGEPGTTMTFGQQVTGAIRDSDGNLAYSVLVTYQGRVSNTSGTLAVGFRITELNSTVFQYSAPLTLSGIEQAPDGSWIYHFAGTYNFNYSDGDPAPLAQNGLFNADISFWRDGSIFLSNFAIQ
ncbi:MAG: RNA polymerase sigma factor [Actinomycetota bacterium]